MDESWFFSYGPGCLVRFGRASDPHRTYLLVDMSTAENYVTMLASTALGEVIQATLCLDNFTNLEPEKIYTNLEELPP